MPYLQVILPLPLPKILVYHWDTSLIPSKILPGQRVIVQLGDNKLFTAVVKSVSDSLTVDYPIRDILAVLDDKPILSEQNILFWEKMAAYYMCTVGEVMAAALPSGLKLSSDSRFVLNSSTEHETSSLSDREYLLYEAIETSGGISVEEAAGILQIKTVHPYLKALIDKGFIRAEQELNRGYTPKMVRYILLAEQYYTEDELKGLFDSLSKAAKQSEVLTSYIVLSEYFSGNIMPVPRRKLTASVESSSAAIAALVKKGVFVETEIEEDRIRSANAEPEALCELNEEQTQALNIIRDGFKSGRPGLLYGVTSSGKTEVYLKLIEETLNAGKQILYLLPEIALTTQIILRIHRHFPGITAVYHSRFNENERAETWNRVNNQSFRIILGARSALFLPFKDLGLVIVDEEHEATYKQYDPAPRYNARDFAIVLAAQYRANVLLGSATPSVETFYNARNGKYFFAELKKRYGKVRLPEIFVSDIKAARKNKEMKSHFSAFLLEHMETALKEGDQVILFQNRRGYSLLIECGDCGNIPQCKNCDISLTYHKTSHQMRCRYCGFSSNPPAVCAACGGQDLQMKGFGTEKIEDELPLYFPDKKVARLDLDAASSKYSYQNILKAFSNKEIDILVGTQMVSKGLDFDHVSLVGILNADNMLFFPEFRAHERAFQMMTQVSGRAGRREKRGKVIIQTANPEHFVIRQVIEHDYEGFYAAEILERRKFGYPPFGRPIRITVAHKELLYASEAAGYLGNVLREHFSSRLLGPEPPAVGRIKNMFLFQILIKLNTTDGLSAEKKEIRDRIAFVKSIGAYKQARIILDVDPV